MQVRRFLQFSHRKKVPLVKVRAGLACEVSAVETSPQAYTDWIGLLGGEGRSGTWWHVSVFDCCI